MSYRFLEGMVNRVMFLFLLCSNVLLICLQEPTLSALVTDGIPSCFPQLPFCLLYILHHTD